MDSDIYEGLLRDIITEINVIAEDHSALELSEFERGYRAGMMVIMKVLQDEISAFNVPDLTLNLVNVDEWFRGNRY